MVPGRYAKLIKQGKYAKVPAKFLTPDQQKIRTARIRAYQNRTLYNPLAQLSGNQLRSAVNQIVGLQINPQLKSLDKQQLQAQNVYNFLSQRSQAGYNQLQGMMGENVQAATTSRDQLAQILSGIGTNQQQAISAAEQGAQRIAAEDARVRGLDPSISTKLAGEFAQQKITAAQQNAAYQQQGAAMGAGALNTAQIAAQVLPARALDAQNLLAAQLLSTTSEILGKKQEVQAQRAGLTAQTLSQLRQSEFEKAATMQTLNIQGQQAATSAYNAETARRKMNKKSGADRWNEFKIAYVRRFGTLPPTGMNRNQRLTAEQKAWELAFEKKKGYKIPTGPPKGGKGTKEINPWTGEKWQSPTRQADAKTKVDQMVSAITSPPSYPKDYTGPKIDFRHAPHDVVRDALINKFGVSKVLANAAIDLARRQGQLTPETIRQLRAQNIQASKIGKLGRPLNRKQTNKLIKTFKNTFRR